MWNWLLFDIETINFQSEKDRLKYLFFIVRESQKLSPIYIYIYSEKIYIYIYIYIAKRFSNPRKEGTPCDGDGKRK